MNTFLAWDITSDGFSVFWEPGGQDVTEDFVVVATEGDTVLELQASTANEINYLRFENLKPATVYEIRLMTGSTILSSNRTLTKPNPVTLLSLESATATTLGLRWTAPPDDVNSYWICYQAQNMNRIEMTQFDQTTVELQNLQSGTVYSISVTACSNVNGLTRCSTTTYRYFATVSTSIPTTPDTIRVDNIDSNTVRLSWDLPSGSLEAFELDYSPQFGYPPPPIRMPASQTSFQLEYLLSSTDYQFSLVATSGRKLAKVQSSATEMSSRTADGPFDVQIYNIQETSAVILYGREPQAVTYRISYLVEGQTSGQDVRQDSDIPRLLTLYNLSPNTTYNVIVTAFNAVQTELGRVETTFQTLEEVTATYVSFSIPLPSLPDVEQYQVQLHLAGDGGFGAAIGEPVTIDRSVCPRAEFGNLRPDSIYEVVTSVIVGGRRTQGTVVGVNTKSLGPLEVSLSDVGTTSVELVWGPVAGNFTGYNLTYVSPDLVWITVSLDPSLEKYLLTALQPGTVYQVLLRQIGGPLFFTGEVVTRPLTPSNLRFQDVRTQSLTAVWDSPHTSFEICHSPVGNLPSPYRLEQTELDFVNLQAATETSVTVYAVSRLGTVSYRSFPVTATGRTLDREPGDVQVDGFTTTTIDISWIGLPQPNVAYSIVYDVDGFDGSSNSATTTNTEYTLTTFCQESYIIFSCSNRYFLRTIKNIQRTLPNSPVDISVPTRDETFIQLIWSEAPQGTNYQYRLQVLNPQLQVVTEIFVMSSDVLVENLVPGTKYTFVLTSVSGNGFFETESLPINITAITLLHIDVMTGPSSIRMIWEEPNVGTFDRYEINYEPCISQPCSQEIPSNFPGAFINGITPGSVVTVRVTLKNDFGEIMLIGVIVVPLEPLEVSNLRYSSRRTEIRLDWDANTLYDSFEIDYEPMDGLIGGGINVTSWHVVIQGLTPGQEYTFDVTTIANDVRSTPASILALTIPEAIETFEVSDIRNGDIRIAWIPPVMEGLPIDEYLVRIRPDGNERDTILRSIPPTETTDRFNGATGFYYEVSLTSVVRGQQGDTSESEPVSAGVLLAPAPAILNTPTDEDVGATFADLSWMTTGSRLYYEIFYESNSTGESSRTIPATENTFRLEDLTPSTLYNVSLEAVSEFQTVDGELIEARSDPSFLMISTKSLPPRNLSALSVEATSVTWVWLPPNDTANTYSYIVQISPGQLSQEINATIFDALGLNDETEYTISVLAVLGMSQSLPLRNTVTTLSSSE
ncbi:hypothetical protein BSL78_19868 [Apostichopus japonicus]|uniref:Fibronectin type-III domain-containing protein n=1 Tax=Stichopus japonicus TaxID=307972 RepID=A0A2G8K5H5_STIJA|nr:hypothetical protein BSL78_19868 [Apostichopus japonicus]